MSHNDPSPETETPSVDRIGQAITLAGYIQHLREAKSQAARITDGDFGPRSLSLASRVSSFCRDYAELEALGIKGDALLVERLQLIASHLERKTETALEAAEARLRELFREESPATSGGRIAFRDVLEKGKAKKLEAWQQATIDQTAREVGVEPHPAGAEFSADPAALRNVEQRDKCFNDFASSFEIAGNEARVTHLLKLAGEARDRDEITTEQLAELAKQAEAALQWIKGRQPQNVAFDVTAPPKTKGGAQ